ncbi:MAG: hypothetical protein AAB902_02470, partial [Patescibacteria group bacterium]
YRTPDGFEEFYSEDGILKRRSKIFPDGINFEFTEFYSDKGIMYCKEFHDGTKEYYNRDSGMVYRREFPDGTKEYYKEDGTMSGRKFPDGSEEQYDGNGKVWRRISADGIITDYDYKGEIIRRYRFGPDGEIIELTMPEPGSAAVPAPESAGTSAPEVTPPATPARKKGKEKRRSSKWIRNLALAAGLAATGGYVGEKLYQWGSTSTDENARRKSGRKKEGMQISGKPASDIARYIGLDNMQKPLSEVVNEKDLEKFVDGIIIKEGGSLAGVRNNPGNIKYTGAPGQVNSGVKATDGGTFASYATPEAGRQAIRNIILGAASGTSSAYGTNPTFAHFISKYTNTPEETGTTPDITTPILTARIPIAQQSEVIQEHKEIPLEQPTVLSETKPTDAPKPAPATLAPRATVVEPFAPDTQPEPTATPKPTRTPESTPTSGPDSAEAVRIRRELIEKMKEKEETPPTRQAAVRGAYGGNIQYGTTSNAYGSNTSYDVNPGEIRAPGELPQGLSARDNLVLHAHPEFVQNNPFHLTEEKLIEAYRVHEKNIAHIFQSHSSGMEGWKNMKEMEARELLENKNPDPNNLLINYIQKLHKITKVPPRGGVIRQAETTEHYIARALQWAAKIGKLSQVEME